MKGSHTASVCSLLAFPIATPTLPSQWLLAPATLYTYQPLLQIAQIRMFRRKRVP
jgi:hypothetical protein